MIEVEELTVRFGGVVSLDSLDLTMSVGTNGLIGPNGAGKTTFFNVLSGFVRPHTGRVRAFGDDLLALADYRRVRWGLRRTFQTEQAIARLTVYENVLLVHENSGGSAATRRQDVIDAVKFVELGGEINRPVGTLDTAQRRLVEVARAVVGTPRLVLLDEPAAGLPDDETAHLAGIIRKIPDATGALVILVDHDMSLVSACCDMTAVLDFGRLIASGETAVVLRDPEVVSAYLGIDEHVGKQAATTEAIS